jgi:hypothetical protein
MALGKKQQTGEHGNKAVRPYENDISDYVCQQLLHYLEKGQTNKTSFLLSPY